MYKAKDGRQFDHQGMGQSYDRHLASKGNAVEEPRPGEDEGASDGQSAEEVVAAHGPAKETRIEKRDDESYSVHSRHEDGHKHASHGHEGAKEAHEHSLKLHGEASEHDDEKEGDEDGSDSDFDESSDDDGGY